MTYRDFMTAAKGELSGVYLFCGAEEYLKQRCVEAARKSLDPDTATFNHTKIDGQQDTQWIVTLSESLQTLPMFGGSKLVELHSVNYSKLTVDEIESLVDVLGGASGVSGVACILVALDEEFDPGTAKAPSKINKQLAPYAKIIDFPRETGERLATWVGRHFTAEGVNAAPNVCRTLVEYCGEDMGRLAAEAGKLSAWAQKNAKEGQTPAIVPDDIRLVCTPGSFHGAFDFSNALQAGRTASALALISEMRAEGTRPEVLLSGIIDIIGGMYITSTLAANGMSKDQIAKATGIHAYRAGLMLDAARKWRGMPLTGALAACMDTDQKIKSTSLPTYTLIERLVMQVCQ